MRKTVKTCRTLLAVSLLMLQFSVAVRADDLSAKQSRVEAFRTLKEKYRNVISIGEAVTIAERVVLESDMFDGDRGRYRVEEIALGELRRGCGRKQPSGQKDENFYYFALVGYKERDVFGASYCIRINANTREIIEITVE